MPISALPSLLLSFPALDPLGLLQFDVFSLWLIMKRDLLARQGLPPMGPSAHSQFRAICYRQSSAHIGHAVAKASVMCLLGVSGLPLPQHVPLSLLRTALAQLIHLCFLPWTPPPRPPPRLYSLPLPLLHDSPLSLDAFPSLLLRALLAFALILKWIP